MATFFHIQASVRGERSYSTRAGRAFLEAYAESHPDDTLDRLELTREAIPAFDATAVLAKYRVLQGDSPTDPQKGVWRQVEDVIRRFKAADKLLISSPMWNFGIPYTLKQYLDVIVQPGYTFSYSPEEGYRGLVTGRPCMLILARGGAYGPGTGAEAYDLQLPYLRMILGFVGYTDVETILVEPTLQKGKDAAEAALAKAVELARTQAGDF